MSEPIATEPSLFSDVTPLVVDKMDPWSKLEEQVHRESHYIGKNPNEEEEEEEVEDGEDEEEEEDGEVEKEKQEEQHKNQSDQKDDTASTDEKGVKGWSDKKLESVERRLFSRIVVGWIETTFCCLVHLAQILAILSEVITTVWFVLKIFGIPLLCMYLIERTIGQSLSSIALWTLFILIYTSACGQIHKTLKKRDITPLFNNELLNYLDVFAEKTKRCE